MLMIFSFPGAMRTLYKWSFTTCDLKWTFPPGSKFMGGAINEKKAEVKDLEKWALGP